MTIGNRRRKEIPVLTDKEFVADRTQAEMAPQCDGEGGG